MPGKSHRNPRRKRQRELTSEGHHSPSPEPRPSDFASDFNQALSDYVIANSPPVQDSNSLACPFLKHDPKRYAYVKNSCTETGFKDVGSLRDHIKRVHSRKFGCTECFTHRFNCAKKKLNATKVKHQSQDECRDLTKKRVENGITAAEPVEWMSEEQEREYEKLDLRKTRQSTPEESFREIYTHLWPESNDDESSIPDYRHESGFLVSRFVINEILESFHIVSYRRLSSARPSQQPLAYEQAGQVALPAEAEVEEESIQKQQPEEPADMLGANGHLYSSSYGNGVANAHLIANTINTRSYSEALIYGNSSNNNNTSETSYLAPENFPSQHSLDQFNHITGSGGGQCLMSRSFYFDPMSLAEHSIESFQYTVQGPTNQSIPDSGYGTNPSGEKDGHKTQPQPPHQHSHHNPQSTTQHDIGYLALHHAGANDPGQIPSGDDELDIPDMPDEENVGDDIILTNYECYLAQ